MKGKPLGVISVYQVNFQGEDVRSGNVSTFLFVDLCIRITLKDAVGQRVKRGASAPLTLSPPLTASLRSA